MAAYPLDKHFYNNKVSIHYGGIFAGGAVTVTNSIHSGNSDGLIDSVNYANISSVKVTNSGIYLDCDFQRIWFGN